MNKDSIKVNEILDLSETEFSFLFKLFPSKYLHFTLKIILFKILKFKC